MKSVQKRERGGILVGYIGMIQKVSREAFMSITWLKGILNINNDFLSALTHHSILNIDQSFFSYEIL